MFLHSPACLPSPQGLPMQRSPPPPSPPVHNTQQPVCLHPDAAVWLHLHHSLFHTIINVSFAIFWDSCNVQSLHPHLLSTGHPFSSQHVRRTIVDKDTFTIKHRKPISLAEPHQSTCSSYHLSSALMNHSNISLQSQHASPSDPIHHQICLHHLANISIPI